MFTITVYVNEEWCDYTFTYRSYAAAAAIAVDLLNDYEEVSIHQHEERIAHLKRAK